MDILYQIHMGSEIPKAFEYAYQKHLGYTRKKKTTPYLVHPMDVASILMKDDAPEHLIIAGLLHDVVEDAGVLIEEIMEKYGEKVAFLVEGASEPKHLRELENRHNTWRMRKQDTVDRIRDAGFELKLLSCADKLSNIRDTVSDLLHEGKEKSDDEDNAWYYSAMLESFSTSDRLRKTRAYLEFKTAVESIYT